VANKQKEFTAIDLFCGAGGLSLGFANAGVKILAGIDNDLSALETFKENFPKSMAISYDLSNIDDGLIRQFGDVDIMLGGPPCQGFSIAGKRNSDDPRNLLFQSYLELVEKISPSVVVIENVPNILSMEGGKFTKNIVKGLENIGFTVEICKLNSAEFGVPQNRKRVFFIASKTLKFDIADLNKKKIDTKLTTYDALSDLPLLENHLGENEMLYSVNYLNSYQKVMRKNATKLRNHIAVDHKPKTKMIISMVPDGGNYKDLPIEYQGTRKVNIAWTRMNSKKPCFTIDAGHNHHFHYKANRVPTVRECARIQSFPDDFTFLGKRTNQYKQVGNAVPPILAKKIAESILKDMY
jgi:DNA (cytosine-5)-methyltransferase 1